MFLLFASVSAELTGSALFKPNYKALARKYNGVAIVPTGNIVKNIATKPGTEVLYEGGWQNLLDMANIKYARIGEGAVSTAYLIGDKYVMKAPRLNDVDVYAKTKNSIKAMRKYKKCCKRHPFPFTKIFTLEEVFPTKFKTIEETYQFVVSEKMKTNVTKLFNSSEKIGDLSFKFTKFVTSVLDMLNNFMKKYGNNAVNYLYYDYKMDNIGYDGTDFKLLDLDFEHLSYNDSPGAVGDLITSWSLEPFRQAPMTSKKQVFAIKAMTLFSLVNIHRSLIFILTDNYDEYKKELKLMKPLYDNFTSLENYNLVVTSKLLAVLGDLSDHKPEKLYEKFASKDSDITEAEFVKILNKDKFNRLNRGFMIKQDLIEVKPVIDAIEKRMGKSFFTKGRLNTFMTIGGSNLVSLYGNYHLINIPEFDVQGSLFNSVDESRLKTIKQYVDNSYESV